MTISAGDQSAARWAARSPDRSVADHEDALPRLGRSLLEPAHHHGRRLDERGVEQRNGSGEDGTSRQIYPNKGSARSPAFVGEPELGESADCWSRPPGRFGRHRRMMHSATQRSLGRRPRLPPRPPRRCRTTRARASADSERTPDRRGRRAARDRCRRDRRIPCDNDVSRPRLELRPVDEREAAGPRPRGRVSPNRHRL